MFAGLYSVMDSFWKQSSPCRRRRQELGVNNPPLDKEDFDLEEGGILFNDRVYQANHLNSVLEKIKIEELSLTPPIECCFSEI